MISVFIALTYLDKVKLWGKSLKVTLSKHAIVQMPKEQQAVILHSALILSEFLFILLFPFSVLCSNIDVIINYLHAKDSITYLPTILCMNSAQVLIGIASKFNIILFNFEFHQSFIPVTWWLSFVLCSVNDPLIVNEIMNLRVSC